MSAVVATLRTGSLALVLLCATMASAQSNVVALLELEGLSAKAAKGDARLQFEVAQHHYYGSNGLSQSLSDATLWYRRAAEIDFAPAQLQLGRIYDAGPAELQDKAEALRWFRKAADHGLPPAQFALGYAYETGRGVDPDPNTASAWYRLAALAGSVEAQFRLGTLYFDGRGVDQSFEEGIKWWRKAAQNGMAEALFNLGLIAMKGQGMPPDRVEAYKWFVLATHQGSKMARANRDALEQSLSARELAEGLQRAEQFTTTMSKATHPQ